jgi:outer membrane protein assembly factor BamD
MSTRNRHRFGTRWLLFLLVLLIGGGLALGGCAYFKPKEEPLGAEIRKTLGVDSYTITNTENLPERNYDPLVILKRGEAYYMRKEYPTAEFEYQRFLDLHPLHEWADYATVKLGLCYYNQMSKSDRDPEWIQKTYLTFQKVLTNYPNSQYTGLASEKVAYAQGMLAEHDLEVGWFYLNKKAYPAAIARFDQVLKNYPNLPAASDALYYLGVTHHRQGQYEEASARLRELIEKYPNSPYQKDAQKLLAKIPQTARP